MGETEDGLSPTQKKGEEISQEEGIINQIRKSDPRIRNKIKELLEKEELNSMEKKREDKSESDSDSEEEKEIESTTLKVMMDIGFKLIKNGLKVNWREEL